MTAGAVATAAAKAALRRRMLADRAVLPEAGRRAAAAALAAAWPALAVPPGAILSGFLPVRGEIDVRPLLAVARAAGHGIALPVIDGVADMEFRLWDPAAPLVAGRFGLSEPGPEAPVVAPDFLLVPLAAFDRRGGRLGYGRGYYDRALARLDALPRLDAVGRRPAVGVAFAMQEVAEVPTAAHDRRLDAVLTEAGLVACVDPVGESG